MSAALSALSLTGEMMMDKTRVDLLARLVAMIEKNRVKLAPQRFDAMTKLPTGQLKQHVVRMEREARRIK